MVGRVGEVLLPVLVGSLVGACWFSVFMGWLLRKTGSPEAQGRRVLGYLIASSVILGSLSFWLIVGPWLSV